MFSEVLPDMEGPELRLEEEEEIEEAEEPENCEEDEAVEQIWKAQSQQVAFRRNFVQTDFSKKTL